VDTETIELASAGASGESEDVAATAATGSVSCSTVSTTAVVVQTKEDDDEGGGDANARTQQQQLQPPGKGRLWWRLGGGRGLFKLEVGRLTHQLFRGSIEEAGKLVRRPSIV
jgi:hypothetical protein